VTVFPIAVKSGHYSYIKNNDDTNPCSLELYLFDSYICSEFNVRDLDKCMLPPPPPHPTHFTAAAIWCCPRALRGRPARLSTPIFLIQLHVLNYDPDLGIHIPISETTLQILAISIPLFSYAPDI